VAGHWEGPYDGCLLGGEADSVDGVYDNQTRKTTGGIQQRQSFRNLHAGGSTTDCTEEQQRAICGALMSSYGATYDACLTWSPAYADYDFCIYLGYGTEMYSVCQTGYTSPIYYRWECP